LPSEKSWHREGPQSTLTRAERRLKTAPTAAAKTGPPLPAGGSGWKKGSTSGEAAIRFVGKGDPQAAASRDGSLSAESAGRR